MSFSKSNWVFVTAGVGSENFEKAAFRLANDARDFKVFNEIICITNVNVSDISPKLNTTYSIAELEQTQGYGFYSWKSSIAHAVMSGKFGKFDGMVFLDAGCEVLPNFLNISRLLKYMKEAELFGATAFAIATPECQFTKSDLFKSFPNQSKDDYTPQFQSGSFFLSGDAGRSIAEKWNRIVWEKKSNVTNDISESGERPDFVVHRHDQSVFSLVLKEYGINPHLHSIPGQPNNILRLFLALNHPFWWSRNRSGTSIIPMWLKIIGKLTLLPRNLMLNRKR